MGACRIERNRPGKPRTPTTSRIDAVMDALGLSVGATAAKLGITTRQLLELRKTDSLPQMHAPRVALERLAKSAGVKL